MKQNLYNMALKIYGLINSPFSIFENKGYDSLTARLCVDHLGKQGKGVYQYVHYPDTIQGDEVRTCKDFSNTAIILQGPVLHDDNFTIETAIAYRKCFPGAKIIISTWKNEENKIKDVCFKEGIYCVFSDTPEMSGAGNVNMQLVSTRAGVQFAKTLGVQYLAKTRTDQRFYAKNWLQYVNSLISTFPTHVENQKERIVFLESNGTYKYLAFHICDFFAFGNIADIEGFYGAYLDEREKNSVSRKENEINEFKRLNEQYENCPDFNLFDYEEFAKKLLDYKIIEFWLQYKYVVSVLGKEINENNMLVEYWKYLKDYTVIADSFQMQFYWPKYRRKFELQSKEMKQGKLDFGAWLDLYNMKL